MHLDRKAGERLYVDDSGKKLWITDRRTREKRSVELFVTALGASGLIYAEATETQQTQDFCESVARACLFYGGVPRLLIPDNLNSAILKFRKGDTPILNPTLRDLAEFFRVGVLPARPRTPRDKAVVEMAVLLIQRKMLGALRTREYFRLDELNEVLRRQVQEINEAKLQREPTSRRALFEELDRPALRPLPQEPYEVALWIDV